MNYSDAILAVTHGKTVTRTAWRRFDQWLSFRTQADLQERYDRLERMFGRVNPPFPADYPLGLFVLTKPTEIIWDWQPSEDDKNATDWLVATKF